MYCKVKLSTFQYAENCKYICANDNRCTHFTWAEGVCYLKQHSNCNAITLTSIKNSVCGYIVQKIVKVFNWKDGSKKRVKWSSDCDYCGMDIQYIPSSKEECVDHCANNSRCTHFTWANGFCWLKQSDSGSIIPVARNGTNCGYVVKFFRWIDGTSYSRLKWNSGPDVFRAREIRT